MAYFSFSSEGPEKRSSSEDLKLALRRLSLRRQNCLSERRFFEGEHERRHLDAPLHGIVSGESIMSLGMWPSRPYLPDKLQIVKPLEGEMLQPLWVTTETSNQSKSRPCQLKKFLFFSFSHFGSCLVRLRHLAALAAVSSA